MMELSLPLAEEKTEIHWTGCEIGLGSAQVCVGGAIVNPSEFYLNSLQTWEVLEAAQKKLDNFFEKGVGQKTNFFATNTPPRNKDDDYYQPDPKALKPGMYVAVWAEMLEPQEWHRGLILDNLEDQKFKIMLIDYGEKHSFGLKDIRSLPTQFLELPAQAIRCQLDFGNELNTLHSRKGVWTRRDSKKFKELIKDQDMVVEFLSYQVDMNLVNPIIWLVKINRHEGGKVKLDGQGKALNVKKERLDEEFVALLGEKRVKRRLKETPSKFQPTKSKEVKEPVPGPSTAAKESNTSTRMIPEEMYAIEISDDDDDDEICISLADFKGLLIPKNRP